MLAIHATGFAQQRTWQVTVLDSATGMPVKEARIVPLSQRAPMSPAVLSDNWILTGMMGEATVPIADSIEMIRIEKEGYLPAFFPISKLPGTVYLSRLLLISYETLPPITHFEAVTIFADKLEGRKKDQVQAMAHLDKEAIGARQTTDASRALENVPGLVVMKGQVNIRGISGFSYGSGTRTMLTLDGMPLISADAGDIKWDYLPLEVLSGISVLKGPASALYGSSALEGVISAGVLTPAKNFEGKIGSQVQFYGQPQRNEARWRTGIPTRQDVFGYMGSAQKNFTLLLAGRVWGDDSYRMSDSTGGYRVYGKIASSAANQKPLQLSASAGYYHNKGSNFLFSQNVSQPYLPYAGTAQPLDIVRYHADGSAVYKQSTTQMHTIRARLFATDNRSAPAASSLANGLFAEYFGKTSQRFGDSLYYTLTYGLATNLQSTRSAEIFGNHQLLNFAPFVQSSVQLKKLRLEAGARYETFRIDDTAWRRVPVFRIGANLKPWKGTALRAMLGEGFRHPSVSELFTTTSAGALKIFPSPGLVPESGWQAEIGFNQSVALGAARLNFELSGYWAEFTEMIEFRFGLYAPPGTPPTQLLKFLGFSARNVTRAQVKGAEAVAGGILPLGRGFELLAQAGYTYSLPVNLNFGTGTDTGTLARYLPYRRSHIFRSSVGLRHKNFDLILDYRQVSGFLSMDQFFINLIDGLGQDDYWKNYSAGGTVDVFAQATIARKSSGTLQVSAGARNLLNSEWMEVMGNTIAPRSFTVGAAIAF